MPESHDGRSVSPTYMLELTLDEVAALINHLSARLIKFPDDDLRSVVGKAMLVYSPATSLGAWQESGDA